MVSLESQGNWFDYDPKFPPAWLKHTFNYRRPDKLIHPNHSHVVSVRGSDFQASDRAGAGFTLRFPRLDRIRGDKTVAQIEVWSEMLKQLEESKNGRLLMAKERLGVLPARPKVKRQVPKLYHRFPPVDAATVTRTSDLFAGKRLFLLDKIGKEKDGKDMLDVDGQPFTLPDGSALNKGTLNRLLVQHGAQVTLMNAPSVWVTVADADTVSNTSGSRNFVRSVYILDCVAAGRILDLHPGYMLDTSNATAKTFLRDLDVSGDSFTQEMSPWLFKEWLRLGLPRRPDARPPTWNVLEWRTLEDLRRKYIRKKMVARFKRAAEDSDDEGGLEGGDEPGDDPGAIFCTTLVCLVPSRAPEATVEQTAVDGAVVTKPIPSVLNMMLRVHGAFVHEGMDASVLAQASVLIVDEQPVREVGLGYEEDVAYLKQRINLLRALAPVGTPVLRASWVWNSVEAGHLLDTPPYHYSVA
jgi:hypothetical protein